MKKIISSILVLCCILVTFVSCGGSAYVSSGNQSGNNTNQSGAGINGNTSTNPEESEKTLTAYEQLNENEKFIFDAFMINFDDFISPASVRVTKILVGTSDEWDTCGDKIPQKATSSIGKQFGIQVVLRLSAESSVGNKVNSHYLLWLTDGTDLEVSYRGRITKIADDNTYYTSQPEFMYASPAKINKAIIEYCEEMGLN